MASQSAESPVPDCEFYFDFSCPYAYLGSTQIEAIAARTGARFVPKPMLLGGVFRRVAQHQNLAATLGAEKAAHMRDDLRRWSQLWDVPLNWPAGHPMRTVKALRAVLAVGEPLMPLSHAFFRAYWVDRVDLTTDEGVASVLTAEGHDAAAVLARSNSDAIKQELRDRTDEAIGHGIFGAPATVVDSKLFWGQDRLDEVEKALGGTPEPAYDASIPAEEAVDFWFDFSSPYACIASANVEAAFGDKVRFRPMLLGAVFKKVGMANIPMATFSDQKRVWSAGDMNRQAKDAGFPFRWPSRFPMKTTLPLRVALALGPDTDAGRAFTHRVFRGYWAEDRDISQADVIRELLAESVEGVDADEVLATASAEAGKKALFAATDEAAAAGVFGAPTFIVKRAEGASRYWGADRLGLVAASVRGDRRLQ